MTRRTVTSPPSPARRRPPSRVSVRPALVTSLLTALVAALAGCTGGPDPVPPASSVSVPAGVKDPAADPALSRFYGQKLGWTACGGDVQCATLTVPRDWSQPAGASLGLKVARRAASGSRVGALVFNPGGPGVGVLPYVQAARQLAGKTVTEHFDFVGLDPRGVGESDPVRCLSDAELDRWTASDSTPDDAAEVSQAAADAQEFVKACRDNSDDVLEHMDTASVARDLDVLRAALGEGRLTYWGASYGTYLGAWYAHLFPWRVGRMLLDGAVDPGQDAAGYVEGQARGFDRGLRAFVADCLKAKGCPLKGTVDQALAQLGGLVERLDSAPLDTGSERKLTQSLFITSIGAGLYDATQWPALRSALSQAFAGRGKEALALADGYLERDDQGRYGQTLAANPSVFCQDFPESRSPEQIAEAAAQLQRRYPPLGASIGWGTLSCSAWPDKPAKQARPVGAQGAAPSLVLGTTGDPATPYEWAQALAKAIPSRLLTREGQGHTGFRRGNSCVDDAVEAYLVAGTLPADGTRCR
ncbi:MAG: alpha/beta hydrolase [Kineosporiaceae bacterium]